MLLRTILFALSAALLPVVSHAAEFFVAPDGRPGGDGSRGRPWDLQSALNQPAAVKPGDTIWLRGGTYRGSFRSKLTGSPERPIIVRQLPGERAVIDGATGEDPTFAVDGADTWYWGFELTNTSPDRASKNASGRILRAQGFNVHAPRAKLINLVAHDTAIGFGFWSEAPDAEMYGCLSYFNGYSNFDHGIYTQNRTGTKRLSDNIVFGNASYGIHGYATEGFLDNFVLEGNVCFNNGGLYRPDYGCNILLGASQNVAHNPTLVGNFTYFDTTGKKGSNNLGYSAGAENAVLRDNYFACGVDRALVTVKAAIKEMTGNTFFGQVTGFQPGEFPRNTYLDAAHPPKGVRVFVRPNKYEPGRANVVVYNWDKREVVDVDLAQIGLGKGERFEVRDVQNYPGPPVLSGTYQGGKVKIPMREGPMAAPIGKIEFPPKHTSREFGAFVVVKVGA